jgi:outer membrane immunogenic protein
MRTLFLGGAMIVALIVGTPVMAAGRGPLLLAPDRNLMLLAAERNLMLLAPGRNLMLLAAERALLLGGGSIGRGGGGGGGCSVPTSPGCFLAANAANASVIAASTTGSLDPSAVTGAIQAGYNWQVDNVVYGLASDLSWFNLSGMRQVSVNYPASAQSNAAKSGNIYTVGTSFQSNSLFTLRGRLGFAESSVLAYVTGGLALSDFRMASSSDNSDALGAFSGASNSVQRTGWTVGGGLEWAVTDRWTVKGEYLFVNLGSVATWSPATGFAGYANGPGASSDLTAHIARGGVNYKF